MKYFLVVVMTFAMGQKSAKKLADGRIINCTLEIYVILQQAYIHTWLNPLKSFGIHKKEYQELY